MGKIFMILMVFVILSVPLYGHATEDMSYTFEGYVEDVGYSEDSYDRCCYLVKNMDTGISAWYDIANIASGYGSIRAGVTGLFYINNSGKIRQFVLKDTFTYCYVIALVQDSLSTGRGIAQIMTEDGEIKTHVLAETVTIDRPIDMPDYFSGLYTEETKQLLEGNLIKYEINSSDEINRVGFLRFMNGNGDGIYTYNEEDNTFACDNVKYHIGNDDVLIFYAYRENEKTIIDYSSTGDVDTLIDGEQYNNMLIYNMTYYNRDRVILVVFDKQTVNKDKFWFYERSGLENSKVSWRNFNMSARVNEAYKDKLFILAAYNDGQVVALAEGGEDGPAKLILYEKEVDYIKVFMWEDANSMLPIAVKTIKYDWE